MDKLIKGTRVAIYVRESADESMSRGASVPSQVADLTEYCRNNELLIIEEYIDSHERGWSNERAEMMRLMDDVKSRRAKYTAVLVWDYSRWYRSTAEGLSAMAELEAHGVILVSITEGYVEGAEGQLMRTIKLGVADYFRADLGRKVRRGHVYAVSQGYAHGGMPPYGYRSIPVPAEGEKGVRYKYIPEPVEAEAVRIMYRMAGEGSSNQEIADYLNEHGYKPRRADTWQGVNINNVYKNELTYLGHQVYGRRHKTMVTTNGKKREGLAFNAPSEWVITPDAHEPIVTENDVRLRNESRQWHRDNIKRALSFPQHEVMLRGLAVCGECGKPMRQHCKVWHTQGQRREILHYHCKRECSMPYRRVGDIDPPVTLAFIRAISSPDFIGAVKTAFDKRDKRRHATVKQKREETEKSITEAEKSRQRYIDAIDDGMPWSLAGEKIGEIDRRISTLKQQLLQDISTIDTDEEAQRLRVMDAVARWEPRKGTHRFNLIHPLFAAMIDRAVVDMEQVTLHWRVEALPELVVPYASTSRKRRS